MAVPLAVVAGLIVPQAGAHAVPFCVRVQETPLLLESFVTVAVNCWVVATMTLAVVGEIETPVPRIVTVAAADSVGAVTDVAITVTVGFAGTVAGAVNVAGLPLAVVVGAMVPQPGEQAVPPCVNVQVTPLLLGSFATVAVNCCVPFIATLTVAGVTAI